MSEITCACGATDAEWRGDPLGARTYCCEECWTLLTKETTYEAYRYAAEGHGGEVGDGDVIATGAIEEVREAIARRIEGDFDEMRWCGTLDDVEAYHESRTEGAGGYAIREAE